jgi:hypothetical protein
MINLEKGQRVKLQDAIKLSPLFSLEIGIKGNAVYNFSCFGLDSNGRSRDEYFIFFNNLNCPGNAIVLKCKIYYYHFLALLFVGCKGSGRSKGMPLGDYFPIKGENNGKGN